MRRLLTEWAYWSLRLVYAQYEYVCSLIWSVTLLPLYVIFLRCDGFRGIRAFRVSSWHLSSRYLTAEIGGVRCFLKCGKRTLVQNEERALLELSRIEPDYFPRVLGVRHSGFPAVNYVATEFLAGYVPLDSVSVGTAPQINALRKALNGVLRSLECAKICHRDLGPGNVFVNPLDFGDVKIIDFAMATGPDLRPLDFWVLGPLVERFLGNEYRPGNGQWDDEFSVRKVLSEFRMRSGVN